MLLIAVFDSALLAYEDALDALVFTVDKVVLMLLTSEPIMSIFSSTVFIIDLTLEVSLAILVV